MTETPKFIFQAQLAKPSRQKAPQAHFTRKRQENTLNDKKLHVIESAEQIEQLSYGKIQNHLVPKHQPLESKQIHPSSIQPEQVKFNEKILITLGVDGENPSSLYFEDKKDSNFGIKTKDTLDHHQRYTVKTRNGEKKKDDKRDIIFKQTKHHFNKPEKTSFDSSTLNDSSNIIINLNQSKILPLESKQSVKHLTNRLQSEFCFRISKTFGVNFFKPQFKLQNNEVKISAKKISNCFGSCFEIFSQAQNKIIGYLKGNLAGTKFNVYQFIDGNPIIATIVYKTDIVCSDTYRKIDIYLRKNGELNENKPLDELYLNGMSQDITKMVTKEPYWNPQLNVFSMNFKGKGKMSSRNNVIFVQESNKKAQTFLFCKQEQDIYFLATNKQFSPLVSMGYLLSSFDFKLLCQ